MSSAANADDSDKPATRWPLLPDNELHGPDEAPLGPAKVVREPRPVVRRSAIAITTHIGTLRRIIKEESRLDQPRSEMIAMCNQQIDRVRTLGFEGDD